jgi:RHS repeat-associated protein
LGTTLTWYANNLPKAITKDANNSSIFQYGPSRARWNHIYKTGGTTFTHTYISKLMEKVVSGTTIEFKHFISVNGQSLTLYSRKSTSVNATYYRHDDHLGSTEHLTDNAGANVVMESFGAYGSRRGSNWTGAPTPADLTTINNTTRKGYTEHEMLDSTGLVHMNGRVYDPVIGRFVSADPVSGCGKNTQNRNRFAYVRNQPLSATDPTGFWPVYCTLIYGDAYQHYVDGWSFQICIDLHLENAIYDLLNAIFNPLPPPAVPQPAPVNWQPDGVPRSAIQGSDPNPPTDPSDGCGSRHGTELNGNMGLWDYTDACVMHDRCYRRCGVSKSDCDSELWQNLNYRCGLSYGDYNNDFYGLGIQDNSACYAIALVAYGVVREGQLAEAGYREGQLRGCSPT